MAVKRSQASKKETGKHKINGNVVTFTVDYFSDFVLIPTKMEVCPFTDMFLAMLKLRRKVGNL